MIQGCMEPRMAANLLCSCICARIVTRRHLGGTGLRYAAETIPCKRSHMQKVYVGGWDGQKAILECRHERETQMDRRTR